MSSIISIEKLEDKYEIGYVIKTTDDGEIKAKISNNQCCCEIFYTGVLHNGKNAEKELEEWNGRKITGVVISENQGFYYRNKNKKVNNRTALHDDNLEYEDEQLLWEEKKENEIEDDVDARYRTVSIQTEENENPLIIYLYNCHNGYYSHNCCIKWKNIEGIPDNNISFSL